MDPALPLRDRICLWVSSMVYVLGVMRSSYLPVRIRISPRSSSGSSMSICLCTTASVSRTKCTTCASFASDAKVTPPLQITLWSAAVRATHPRTCSCFVNCARTCAASSGTLSSSGWIMEMDKHMLRLHISAK